MISHITNNLFDKLKKLDEGYYYQDEILNKGY